MRLSARGVGGNKALGTTLAYSDHDDVGGDDSDDTEGSGSNKALGRTLAYGDPSWVSTWYLDPACSVLSRAIIKEEDGKKLNMSSIF